MFWRKTKKGRLPLSMYCPLMGIEGFEGEKEVAHRVLESQDDEKICVCVLPVLEDGRHYYFQCNFKRAPNDMGDFKVVNTLDLLCEQRVLPTLDREHAVDAYLFLDKAALEAFAARSIHRAIRGKFELVARGGAH